MFQNVVEIPVGRVGALNKSGEGVLFYKELAVSLTGLGP